MILEVGDHLFSAPAHRRLQRRFPDSGAANQVINYLSIVTHFDNFSKGLIELKDIVFYVSMIFFALFLTSRSMESLRWRA